jgi:hypothetical protein
MKAAQTTCTHKWQVDRKNVGTCSVCGEVRQFPLEKGQDPVVLKPGNPPGKNPRQFPTTPKLRAAWCRHENNKQAIIADLLVIGNTATCKKWGILPQTMSGLKQRWLTPEERSRIFWDRGGHRTRGTPGQPPQIGHLPTFPEFSGTWDPSVQLKWLEVYENLHVKGKNAG